MRVTERQAGLIQTSYMRLVEDIDLAAEMFYKRLFALEPATRTLFKGDMQSQGRKLIQMLLVAVNGAFDLEGLDADMRTLGEEHIDYGVKVEYFEPLGTALVETVATTLGSDFTPEMREAWQVWYSALADMVKRGMDTGGASAAPEQDKPAAP